MLPPDCDPIITKDIDGWRVGLVRNGRVHVYLCETEADAKRFAALLGDPPREPPARRNTPEMKRAVSPREEPLSLLKSGTRWR